LVTTVQKFPFERKCASGQAVCGVRNRRIGGGGAGISVRPSSTGRGLVIETSRGRRSCRSISVARIRGSSWKRFTIAQSFRTFAKERSVMPWWWARYDCTITGVRSPGFAASASSRPPKR